MTERSEKYVLSLSDRIKALKADDERYGDFYMGQFAEFRPGFLDRFAKKFPNDPDAWKYNSDWHELASSSIDFDNYREPTQEETEFVESEIKQLLNTLDGIELNPES